MKLNRKEIMPKLVKILNKINYQPELYVEENFDCALTGSVLCFDEYDMIYLVMEIAETFGVFMEKTDFDNYRFNTINNIIDSICEKEIC